MAMAEIDNVAPYFYSDARERPGIVPRTQVRVAHGRLPPPANIKLLPECSHASAIAAMATFSVGLIPFKLNRLTASVDPIKYYEYRALGLPVLCTRFGEMALRDKEPGVWILDEDSDRVRPPLKRLPAEVIVRLLNSFVRRIGGRVVLLRWIF